MNLKFTSFFLALFLVSSLIEAQDLHFTQFEFAPLTVNPGLAGAYNGSYRVGGIVRDQYSSVATKGFQTIDFYVDAPIIRGFRKQDWIGIGVGMDILDQAGALGYKTSFYRVTGAYHFSLDAKQTSIFTLGVQLNNASVSIDQFSLADTRPGVTQNSDGDLAQLRFDKGELSDGYSDYVIGLMYNARGKDSDLKIGIATARVLGPELRLAQSLEKLDFRITAFGNYTMQMNAKTSFSPGFLFQKQGPASEIVVQGKMGYLIKPDKGIKLNAGLGYRLGDALQIIVGMDIKNLRVGLGYDMNISSLSAASGTVGGIEVGVSYFGSIFKKPKIKPIIVCPRL